jgi:hypothetical protein
MALGRKDRIPSPILSVSIVVITTVNGAIVVALKAPALEVFKPKLFAGFK